MSLEPEDPVKEVGMFYWLSCSIIKKLVPLAGFMEREDELNSVWHYLLFFFLQLKLHVLQNCI